MKSIEQQKAHFESIAEIYYESRQSENHLLLKDLMWGYFFKDKDYLKKRKVRVLEPMCGYAEGKRILQRHLGVEIEYEGFDFSLNLIKKVKKLYPSINIYRMDVTQFKTDVKYDIVILLSALHHLPDKCNEIISNLSKQISSHGYLINLEPTHNNFLYKKIRKIIYKKNKIFDEKTEEAFDLKHYNNLFSDKGLETVDQIYPGLLSHILYYNPEAFPSLNIGKSSLVKFIFNIDKRFFRTTIGRKLSFATLSIFRKT